MEPTLDPCQEFFSYGICDRSSTSVLDDQQCLDHTCTDFANAPFNDPSTIGGYYNWTGGLPPQPFILRDGDMELGTVIVWPAQSICLFNLKNDDLRLNRGSCHISRDFPVDASGMPTTDPESFRNEGCENTDEPSQCIIIDQPRDDPSIINWPETLPNRFYNVTQELVGTGRL